MRFRNSQWRQMVAVGVVACAGAVYPLSASAQQQPEISGAAVEVGGVQANAPSAGAGPRVLGAQGRGPVILPNTGTGPMDDANNIDVGLVVSVGMIVLGAGAYAYRRRSNNRIVS